MLEIVDFWKSFDGKPAIAGLSLDVRDNEYLTLLGPSGSGKSMLLRLIAGIERPDRGDIRLDGVSLLDQPTHARGIGFVLQNFALFPHMSVADNVAYGLRHRQIEPVTDESEVVKRVAAMLALVGLDGLEERMVGQISGGQRQRVALARTLVTEPKICLLDEPLGALDANLRARMTVELRQIRKALGVTFVHVTGNENEALAMGDRLVVLDQGKALQVDRPDVVYAKPAAEAVARFLNAFNLLNGRTEGERFVTGEISVALPENCSGADHYAIRYDQIAVHERGAAPAGRGDIEARYVTSEYLGSKFIYFFELAGGKMIEVEQHLSQHEPVRHRRGATYQLSWDLADVLLFDAEGRAIEALASSPARRAV
ncbi:MAG: ABC transporter ATP-binding protein [Alphaproteobacteria bacterium]|nr:ABC transporter ATP-binding protein [Alphaproteobacteria bacterium]